MIFRVSIKRSLTELLVSQSTRLAPLLLLLSLNSFCTCSLSLTDQCNLEHWCLVPSFSAAAWSLPLGSQEETLNHLPWMTFFSLPLTAQSKYSQAGIRAFKGLASPTVSQTNLIYEALYIVYWSSDVQLPCLLVSPSSPFSDKKGLTRSPAWNVLSRC